MPPAYLNHFYADIFCAEIPAHPAGFARYEQRGQFRIFKGSPPDLCAGAIWRRENTAAHR